MARKDKTDLDDLDLDNLDFGDDDLSIDPLEDNRSPVTKVATSFLRGVKDELTEPSNLKRRLLGILPEGYGRAANLADETVSMGKELYDTTAKELKPVTRDFKRATERLMPKVEGKVPQTWYDKIKGYLKGDREREEERERLQGFNKSEVRDSEIAQSMAKIFDAQMQAQADETAERDARQEATDRIQDFREEKRSRTSIGLLDNIRQGIYRQVSYQDRITANYQRKSLELQYRQFFVASDLLEVTRQGTKLTLQRLNDVIKNTGLPEYRKINLHEAGMQTLRDTMLYSTQQSVVNYARDFVGRTRNNLKNVVQRNIQDFSGAMSGVLGMADQMDMGEDGPTIDKYDVAGGTLGGLAGGKLADYAMPYLRRYAKGNDTLSRGNDFLNFFTESLPRRINRWALQDNGETGFGGAFIRTIKDILPKHYLETMAGSSPILDADQPAVFNQLTRRSITEIIPGYLSRIHNELQIMRTGDENTSRLAYNMDQGKFTDINSIRRDMQNRIFEKDKLENGSEALRKLIDRIDSENVLDDDLRAALGRQILRDSAGGMDFDPGRYSQADTFDSNLSIDDREWLAGLFQSRYDVTSELDKNGVSRQTFRKTEDLNETARRFNELATIMPDPRQRIVGYRDVGQREYLEDLGLINRLESFDYVDYDRIWDAYRRGKVEDNAGTSTPPNGFAGSGPGGLGSGGVGGFSATDRFSAAANDVSTQSGSSASAASTSAPFVDWSNFNYGPITDSLEKQTDRIINAIVDGAIRPQADQQVELLTDIRDRLKAGIPHGGPGDPNDPDLRTGRFFNRLGRGFNRGVGKMWEGATSFYQGIFGGLGSVASGAGSFAGNLFRKAGNLVNRTKDRITDIYVQGERNPRLLAFKMRLGHYKDEVSGKVIRTLADLADIEGPIVDEEGNVVVSLEDVRKGLTDRYGKGILKKSANFLWKTARGAFGLATRPTAMAFSLARRAGRFAMKVIDPRVDVYVAGETTPRLLALILRHGGYRNASDGSAIHYLKDIKSDVTDQRGNVVLSVDEMRQGLFDKAGKRLSTEGLLTRVTRWAVRLPGRLLRKASGITRRGFNFLKNSAQGLWDKVRNTVSKGGSSRNRKDEDPQLAMLTNIFNLLDERLAKPIKGDFSGDGYRDGSWQEQLADEREEEKQAEDDAREKGLFGRLSKSLGLGGLGRFNPFNRRQSEDDEEEEDEGDDGDINAWYNGGDKDPNAKKPWYKRWARKGWEATKRGARWTMGKGRAVMTGAAGLGTALMGTSLGASVAGGLSTAAAATTGAVATGASAVGAGLGTAAAGVGAILSAPVTLTALAVAGVGAAGWMTYRHFNPKKTPLADYRYVQYGVLPDDKDQIAKINFLENFLKDNVEYDGIGKPRIRDNDIDPILMMQYFGINTDDNDHVEAFKTWMVGRFLPVYLSHQAALHTLDPNVDLDDVDDDLDNSLKQDYINATSFSSDGPDTPYRVNTSPFGTGLSLAMTASLIGSYKEMATLSISANEGTAKIQDIQKIRGDVEKQQQALRTAANNQQRTENQQLTANALKTAAVLGATNRSGDIVRDGQTAAENIGKLMDQPENRQGLGTNTTTDRFLQDQSQAAATQAFQRGGQTYAHPGNGTGGNINDLPAPTGSKGWDSYKDLIVRAALMTGVDPSLMAVMAGIESSFDGTARAGTSSASGLYQFTTGTWKDMLERYGAKYGLSPNATRFDPRANALMAAEFLKENMRGLARVKPEGVTDTDLYLAHFMGLGGARSFLRAPPTAMARQLFPAQASANQSIFYHEGRARTIAQVYQELDRRVQTFREQYGDKAKTLASTLPQAPANDPQGQGVSVDEAAIATAVQLQALGKGQGNTTTGDVPLSENMVNSQRSTMPEPTSEDSVSQVDQSGSGLSGMRASMERMRASQIQNRQAPQASNDSEVVETEQRQTLDRSGGSMQPELERRMQQEYLAETRDRLARQDNERSNESLSKVVGILEKSLTTQRSMDGHLKAIMDGLAADRKTRGEQPKETAPAPSNVVSGPRPVATASRQAAVNMDRRNTR